MITKKSKGSSVDDFFDSLRGHPLTFGEALAAMRHVHESTQAVFAKKLGISTAHLCDLEKGRRFVSAERAASFARKMKCPETVWVKLAIQDQINQAGLKMKVDIIAA
jgi:antitoxin HigA-1